MIEVRDLVQVLPPFNEAFPDNYGVTAVNGSTATLETGADFDMAYLVKVGVSDVAVAGMPPLRPFARAATPALAVGRPHPLEYLAGAPGPSTATASGISGSYVETQG